MEVHFGTELLRPEWTELVACVGSFDGVHLGHQVVIGEVRALAAARGLQTVVVTFDRHPVSELGRQGTLGLMQVMPDTWREWSPVVKASDPFDSYSNVLVAAAYLDYLRSTLGKRAHPQPEWMLVAYNWGPDHLMDFLASGGTWETLDPVRREYAEQILRITKTIP